MTPIDRTEVLAALHREGVRIQAGPFLVHVRSDLPGVRRHLEQLYGDFAIEAGDGGHFAIAVAGSGPIRRLFKPQATVVVNGSVPFFPLPADLSGPLMDWGINWAIGQFAHRWIAVHAAVVERNGRVVVFSADSGAGKSTLCAALVYSGWRLFSDEFALIHPDTGEISPSPRPIALKNASIGILKSRHPELFFTEERTDVEGARFVHARPPRDSVTRAQQLAGPGAIVFPRWIAGSPTRFEPMPKAQALAHLADQSFNYNYAGRKGFDALAGFVARSSCYTLEYSDLDEAISLFDRVARW